MESTLMVANSCIILFQVAYYKNDCLWREQNMDTKYNL